MKYPKLFTPMQVGTLLFRNRLLSGPNMMCALNPDGSPTDYMVGYYEEKAKGGVAQVTVGDTPVEERGFTTPRHPHSYPEDRSEVVGGGSCHYAAWSHCVH